MPIFQDTFTEAADTLLSAHTPNIGTSWTKLWQDGTNPTMSVLTASGTCKTASLFNNSGVVYRADAAYPSADYYLEFTYVQAPTVATRPLYAIIRMADIENMYAFTLVNVSNSCQLRKKVAGTWSTLGSPVTVANGSVIKLEAIGSTIKVYDDGVAVVTATDTDLIAAGFAGLGNGGGAELALSTDDAGVVEVDNLTVENLGSTGGKKAVKSLLITSHNRLGNIGRI